MLITSVLFVASFIQVEQEVERNVLNTRVELTDGTTDYIFSRNANRNEAKMFTYNCHICSVPNLPGERCLYTHISGRRHQTKLTLKPFNASLFRAPLQRSTKSTWFDSGFWKLQSIRYFVVVFTTKSYKFSFVKQLISILHRANQFLLALRMKSPLKSKRPSTNARMFHFWGSNIYWSWLSAMKSSQDIYVFCVKNVAIRAPLLIISPAINID